MLVRKILKNHNIRHCDQDPDDKKDYFDDIHESHKALKTKHRFSLNNFNNYYKFIKVCNNCYQAYCVISEYFSEMEDIHHHYQKRKARSLSAKKKDYNLNNDNSLDKLNPKKAFLLQSLSELDKSNFEGR